LNGEKTNSIARSSKVSDKGIYYMLYPYFGGAVAAPHDVRIELSVLR
jgi:hypothetical protein